MCVCLHVQGKHNQQTYFARNVISMRVSCKDTVLFRCSSLAVSMKKYSIANILPGAINLLKLYTAYSKKEKWETEEGLLYLFHFEGIYFKCNLPSSTELYCS